jgi:hypothetical protein
MFLIASVALGRWKTCRAFEVLAGHRDFMTEEELDAAGALAVDEDQDELMEDLSLEERQERLKKARWNVFLYLGIAAILFGFALFPMPFSADFDDFSKSAEKDVGLVWGLPLDGEDLFDVPMRLTVTASNPPTEPSINIAVYVIQQDDCTDYSLSDKMVEAEDGQSHAYQYQEGSERVLSEGEYDFEFNIDPGQYCLIAQYINATGAKITDGDMSMSVNGKLYPNQFFGGLLGVACLSLSAFAFVGAQRHGAAMRKMLEGEAESTESKVLSEASQARIMAGPAGPPQDGPPGPPPASTDADLSASPAEPVQPDEAAAADALAQPAPQAEAAPAGTEGTYEPAENGYFFRKMPDGSYDQTVYVQNAEGTYEPYQG